jgi:SAM-dependent methyltransferase
VTELHDLHNLKANEWVLSWLGRLRPGARMLDFASGHGRHALAAQQQGLHAEAWDQNATALADLVQQGGFRGKTVCCDLEAQPWPEAHDQTNLDSAADGNANSCADDQRDGAIAARKFDLVVVTNYLYRPRMHLLPSLLNPGGLLIYQTFAQGHELLGRPRRADFLLRPGELFEWARGAGLHVLAFEDSVERGQANAADEPTLRARVQRLAALKVEGLGLRPELLRQWAR